MSVNSIKATLNDMISDIQFSAINLQSFAMGIDETDDIEEIKAIFEELSAEANVLMDKTSRFITMPTMYDAGDEKEDNWV
jgi:methyl-accepting chemotaxis protein